MNVLRFHLFLLKGRPSPSLRHLLIGVLQAESFKYLSLFINFLKDTVGQLK